MSYDPTLIIFMAQVALKLGPEMYKQLVNLIGPSIPTWDELAQNNAELQAMIDNAKKG